MQNLQFSKFGLKEQSCKSQSVKGAFITTDAKVELFVKLTFIINNPKAHIYLMFKCHSLLIVQNSVEGVFIPANGKVELLKEHSLLIAQNSSSTLRELYYW